MLILDSRFLNSCLFWSEAVHTFCILPWRWMNIAHQGILILWFLGDLRAVGCFIKCSEHSNSLKKKTAPVRPNPQRWVQKGHVLLKLQMTICAHAECCKHRKACIRGVLWLLLKETGNICVTCNSWMPPQPPAPSTDVKWQSNWTKEIKNSVGFRPWAPSSSWGVIPLHDSIKTLSKAEGRNSHLFACLCAFWGFLGVFFGKQSIS